ncbi:MAG: hypothetical protein WCT07_01835 [Candidatus Paceibacterota bacterium]|jgi:hypothetical protein
MNIPQTILNKIKGENIKPRARWYFVMKHLALWFPGVLVTILGAISFAGVLFAFTHAGWEYREFVYPSLMDFFLAVVPFVWIISFTVFGSLIVKALRTTHKGYRLSVKKILLGSIVASLVLGVCIFYVDDAFKVDSIIRYPLHVREQGVWSSPEEGRLAGLIEEKYEDTLEVRGMDNTLWTIDMSGFGSTTFPFVEKGESIKIVGTSTVEGVFVACAVFPWDIGRFPGSPIKNNKHIRPQIKREQNNNPNCKVLLDNIKKHVSGDAKKSMKENKPMIRNK